MLEDNQFVLSHVRNGVNEATRLFADQKLRVDRSMAAGEDAREAQQTLGPRGVPLNLGETQRVSIARKEATSGDVVTPPGYAVRHARMVGWRSRRQHLALGVDSPSRSKSSPAEPELATRREWYLASASDPFDFCLHHPLDHAGQVFVQP